MIAALSAIATLAFIVAGALVGTRLLLLFRKTGGKAEAQLGAAMLLIAGVGYPLVLAVEFVEPGSAAARATSLAGTVAISLGWSFLWVFTWQTFRERALWARALTCGVLASTALLVAWRSFRLVTEPDVAALAEPTLDALGVQLLALGVYTWTSLEGFGHHARLRKQLALGLGDPVTANRFLLWALLGVWSFLSLIGPVAASFARAGADTVPWVRLGTGLAGLVCAVLLQLAFMPPEAYLRRIRAASPAHA